MRTKSLFSVVLIALLVAVAAVGQDSTEATSSDPPQGSSSSKGKKSKVVSSDQGASQPSAEGEGINRGDWNIAQSLELGYRISPAIAGNGRTYNSLVNLHQGFRVLSQTLSLRSLTHTGTLFDNLYISSFGWNGDPTNAVRWSASKIKWYNFSGNFRRDQNFFDYDLLANPLNPPNAAAPFNPSVNFSPHSMELRRRMTDMALTLLPQSPISVRLGYVHNNMTGPSFSSFHEGTDVLLLQPWNTTLNGYRFGVDVKVLPKTIISYDQFLDYFKNDTDQVLAPFPINPATITSANPSGSPFTTIDGIPVAVGLPYQPTANIPCATPFLADGSVNPACSVYQAYSRAQRYRSSQPSEQLTLQSNYFRRIDFVARILYASSNATDDFGAANGFGESFLGVVVRTGVNERAFTLNGLSSSRRVSTTVDLGATIHLGETWRVPINFRSTNFRTPGFFDSTEVVFSPATPALIGGPIGTGVTTSDLLSFAFNRADKRLEGNVEHDFTKWFGARLGLRWTRRDLHHFDFSEETPDFTRVNEYLGLGGVWFRNNTFRGNFDVEAGSADNFLYRISPRHEQRYRLRLSYNPRPWAIASAYANVWEGRNTETSINYKGRNRNFGFNLNMSPNDRYGVDLAYNFNLFSQNSFVCFIGTFSPPGTTPNVAGSPCALASLPNQVYSVYNSHIHYFSSSVYFRPVKRATVNVGYSVDHSDGDFTRFNTLQPLGQINSNYHQPLANLALELHKNLVWNLGWNYWNYEDNNLTLDGSAQAPALRRNFHNNVGTTSLKFAF